MTFTTCEFSLHEFSHDDQEVLAQCLDRYLQGIESGSPPSLSELVGDRHHLADALRGYIDHLADIQDALGTPAGPRLGGQPPAAKGFPAVNGAANSSAAMNGSQTRLGDYLLMGEIGRGGMGIVYRARQLSLGRDVAIKTLPFASVLDPKQVKRFQNEAQAAGQLHHPNIVPVYAVGCERGVHYYSMQLIEGLSLEQVIEDMRCGGNARDLRHQTTWIQPVDSKANQSQRAAAATKQDVAPDAETKEVGPTATCESIRTRRHVESIVGLIIQAADALHYAHQCGVIHRDIKPSNLMIDGRGNLWITDFGLARCQQTTPMSVTGDLMGTLRYMSPEQASGRVHAVDHRTDTYALGVTLYELLTLQFAFDAPNRMELIHKINQTSPISLRKLNPAIPADLETILCKAINHEALDRYDSAGEFADDLRRFLRGEQPLAKRPTPIDRGLKWINRHQYSFLAVAASLIFIICGLSIATIMISKHQRAAQLASERAERHLTETNRVVQNFGTLVVDRLGDSQDGQDIRDELLGELKNYYLDFIAYSSPATNAAVAVSPDEIANAHLKLADVLYQRGEWESSRDHFHASMERNGASDAARNSAAYGTLAIMEADGLIDGAWQTTLGKAIHWQTKVVESAAATNRDIVELAALWAEQGERLIREQQNAHALRSLNQAVSILDPLRSSIHADEMVRERLLELDSICRNNLASIVQATDPDKATVLVNQAIESNNELVEFRPKVARHRVSLARVLANAASLSSQRDDVEKTIENYEKAIESWKALVSKLPSKDSHLTELAANQNSLGQYLLTQKRWERAATEFLDAIETLESISKPDCQSAQYFSDLASVKNNLGLCFERQNQWNDATHWYSQAIESQDYALSIDSGNSRFQERLSLHQRNLARLQRTAIAATTVAQ